MADPACGISKFYLHLGLELGQVGVQFSDMLVNQLVGVDGDIDLVVRDLLGLLEHSLKWRIENVYISNCKNVENIKYCKVEPPGHN